jgi:hypothetical protein
MTTRCWSRVAELHHRPGLGQAPDDCRIELAHDRILLFFGFGLVGRAAALTGRRLFGFAGGSEASPVLFLSKSAQNFAVSCRNCSALSMARSCKRRPLN